MRNLLIKHLFLDFALSFSKMNGFLRFKHVGSENFGHLLRQRHKLFLYLYNLKLVIFTICFTGRSLVKPGMISYSIIYLMKVKVSWSMV